IETSRSVRRGAWRRGPAAYIGSELRGRQAVHDQCHLHHSAMPPVSVCENWRCIPAGDGCCAAERGGIVLPRPPVIGYNMQRSGGSQEGRRHGCRAAGSIALRPRRTRVDPPGPRGTGARSAASPTPSRPIPLSYSRFSTCNRLRERSMTTDTSKFIYVMKDLRKVVPPKREVLKGIWLSFYPGAKIGVVGPNGAGKSTLLRIMAGVDTDFQGEAWAMKGTRIGYLPQEPQLDPNLSVRGNVE